jgi:hypothetical protein
MPFYTSEFRVFSTDILSLYNLYFNVMPRGIGNQEDLRKDAYLNCRNDKNGIKIREGNLEIKVQSGHHNDRDFGNIQQWIKWRFDSEDSLDNMVDSTLLKSGWITIIKHRKIKRYAYNHGQLHYFEKEMECPKGVGIEFTEVQVPEFGIHVGTMGIEAFSENDNREILRKALIHIGIQNLKEFNEQMSYPEFILRYCIPFAKP